MERVEEFTNFSPTSDLLDAGPDADGFYRAKSFDTATERPRNRAGFRDVGRLARSVIESIAITMEIAPLCESPIEIDLAVPLIKAIRILDDATLSLGHQFELGRFRYDLSIVREGRAKPLILIECDGKEFHSTAEQTANDATKDALAANENIPLLRFSGSEIFRDLDICVSNVFSEMRFRGHLTYSDWEALELAFFV
jgi:very-short-patch-repair endonuclease